MKPTKEKAAAATPDMTAQFKKELREIGKAESDLAREIKRTHARTIKDCKRISACAISDIKTMQRAEAKLHKGWTKTALGLARRRMILEGRLS